MAAGKSAESNIAAETLSTVLAAAGLTVGELAERVGCDEQLVTGIERGELDPTLDTLDRIANCVGVEVRAVLGAATRPPHPADARSAERDRVRAALENAAAFRSEVLGLGPALPDPQLQPYWDGADPAPPRQWSAGPHRGDAGGHAASLLKLARRHAQATLEAFAARIGVDAAKLTAFEAGDIRPGTDELAAMVELAGSKLNVRLEVFDPHDDDLHREALRDPQSYAAMLADRARGVADIRAARTAAAAPTPAR